MEISTKEWQAIQQVDDGTLYASPMLVQELLHYRGMGRAQLLFSFDSRGRVDGYLPVGQCYLPEPTWSYIAAMPNSPPVSPTYTPGAERVLQQMQPPYFDTDVVNAAPCLRQYPTASAYGLPLEHYLAQLSSRRRADVRRHWAKSAALQVVAGNVLDIAHARPWLLAIWAERLNGAALAEMETYARATVAWLAAVQYSGRATLKIDRYVLGRRTVGVNACVLHPYRGRLHCDDYLTWYDPEQASGLGISSVIRNLTDPRLHGCRYNLGNPGVGATHPRHAYKLDLIPPALRLTQGVLDTRG